MDEKVKDWQARTLTHLTRFQNLLDREDVLDGAVINMMNMFYPMLSDADKIATKPFLEMYKDYLESLSETLEDIGEDISFVDKILVLIGDEDGKLE